MTYETDGGSLDIVHRFFTGTGTSYDRVVNLCTLGMDSLWKKQILRQVPQNPAAILDLACGTGILTFKLAAAFPSARILGVDVTPEYLEIARIRAKGQGREDVEFILGMAEEVCLDAQFDCIVSSYLPKYADLKVLTSHAATMLRKGGRLVMHDFIYPRNRALVGLWKLYFVFLQTAGTLLYPEWRPAFEGLPDLLEKTVWVEELTKQLYKNDFSEVTEEKLTLGTAAIVTATKT